MPRGQVCARAAGKARGDIDRAIAEMVSRAVRVSQRYGKPEKEGKVR